MKHEFTCHQCKENKVHNSDLSTGYATNKAGDKICYACCGINDAKELEDMIIGGKTVQYMNPNAKEISNWPSTLIIPLNYIRVGRHNIAGKRYDTWFTFKGNNFHAVQYGNNTQIVHIKRIK